MSEEKPKSDWTTNPELVGKFLKFDDKGKMRFVFVDDGEQDEYEGKPIVNFNVDSENATWTFSTGSQRLLRKIKALKKEKGTLVGLDVEITKIGDKFSTDYTIQVLSK